MGCFPLAQCAHSPRMPDAPSKQGSQTDLSGDGPYPSEQSLHLNLFGIPALSQISREMPVVPSVQEEAANATEGVNTCPVGESRAPSQSCLVLPTVPSEQRDITPARAGVYLRQWSELHKNAGGKLVVIRLTCVGKKQCWFEPGSPPQCLEPKSIDFRALPNMAPVHSFAHH